MGYDALLKFNGMFALAFWDRKEKISLARDRYGIKPLYILLMKKIDFCSEHKAILEQPAFDRKINKKLVSYFTFQNIFTDQLY